MTPPRSGTAARARAARFARAASRDTRRRVVARCPSAAGIGLDVGFDLAAHRVTRVGLVPRDRASLVPTGGRRAPGLAPSLAARQRVAWFFGGASRKCNRAVGRGKAAMPVWHTACTGLGPRGRSRTMSDPRIHRAHGPPREPELPVIKIPRSPAPSDSRDAATDARPAGNRRRAAEPALELGATRLPR